MEDDLVRWLRAHGYKANDSVLTRVGAAKLVKGNNRPVWEFLVARARPAAEAQQIKEDAQAAREGGFHDASEIREAKHRARLRAQRQQQQEQNRAMQEMVTRQSAHLQARLAETVSEQGRRASAQQESQAFGSQIHAIHCYKERTLKAVGTMRQLQSGLQQAASQAKGWAAELQALASRAVPGQSRVDMHQVQGVARACASVQTELQTRSILAMQQGDLRLSSGKSGAILLAPPTNCRELNELCASSAPPLVTLHAIIEVMHQAIHSMKDNYMAASNALNGGTTASSWEALPRNGGPDPQLLLRQRQQAHVDKFIATEDMLNRAEDTLQLIEERRAAAESMLVWPYNQLKLQEAWLLAELSALKAEIARLTQEIVGRHHVEAALQDQWSSVIEANAYYREAESLLTRLIKENDDMTVRWRQDGAAFQSWCQDSLSERSGTAITSCSSTCDVVQREAQAASQVNLAACPPSLASFGSPDGRGVLANRSSSLLQQAQLQQALVLFSYGRALPAASDLRASSASPSRQRSSTQHKGGPLPLVLQSARALDTLAPLRCPASFVCSTADHAGMLVLLQHWLGVCKPWLATSAQQLQSRTVLLQPLQQMVSQLIHPPSDPRLVVVKRYIATAQGMQTYAQTRVGQALADWKSLPAVYLLPDVQYAGLNAAEWLSAIQALLLSIREAQGVS